MGNTVTRAQLSEAVHQELGLSPNESAQLVKAVFDEIVGGRVAGERVSLSSFGTFVVLHKSGRMGRNPKTGEEASISPRHVLAFRPSHVLKDQVDRSLSNGS